MPTEKASAWKMRMASLTFFIDFLPPGRVREEYETALNRLDTQHEADMWQVLGANDDAWRLRRVLSDNRMPAVPHAG